MTQYLTIDIPPCIETAPGLVSVRVNTVIHISESVEVIISIIRRVVYRICLQPLAIAVAYIRSLTMRGPPARETYYYAQ